MEKAKELPGVVAVVGPPAIVAIAALLLIVLPSEARVVLLVWTLASFPIGVLLGRYVLSED